MTKQLCTAIRVVSLLATLALLPSGRLAAQPACRVGTLMDYYALGAGGCMLGGVQLSDFDGISDISPSTVEVTPTFNGDWIGFRMTGRLRSTSPVGLPFESYELSFRARSALVSGVRTRVIGVTASGSGEFFAFGSSTAGVQDVALGMPSILSAGLRDVEGAGRIPIDEGGCSPAVVDCTTSPGVVEFAPTAMSFFSTRARAQTGAGIGSTAMVTVDGHHPEFRVTVTPEPGTMALLLSGIAMIGVMFLRRERLES
jgi:hypothetical protein